MESDFLNRWERLLSLMGATSDTDLMLALNRAGIQITRQAVASAKHRGVIPLKWLRALGLRLEELAITQEGEEGLNTLSIPIWPSEISAGGGAFECEHSEGQQESLAFKEAWLRQKGNPREMHLMKVSGDSMEPLIYNKDIVLIDRSQKGITAGGIYAVAVQGLVYLKRLEATLEGFLLLSENPHHPPMVVDTREQLADTVQIIGRALWVGHEL